MQTNPLQQKPCHSYLGCGLGLRTVYYQEILETLPAIDWFEIISEDYLVPGGNPLYYLDKIRAHYPVVMHGVSLSIGSTDPLNWDYLRQLKALADRIQPAWISDHCCWTGINGINIHDLMPLPFTEEALRHVAERIDQVQNFLNRPFVIENVSSYINYTDSVMTEWEFLKLLTEKTGCHLLLDINNVYVSAFNHGFDPMTFINAVPVDCVQQFHLAGHTNQGAHILDTHDAAIIEQVWDLYVKALQRFGKISTLIERDDRFPPFAELFNELQHAKQLIEKVCNNESHGQEVRTNVSVA